MGQVLEVSIVIPAFNEEKRLPQTLDALISAIAAKQLKSYKVKEVVIVDDGSMDRTAVEVEKLASRLPGLKVIRLDQNSGKGKAVRTGMAAAQADWVLMADADQSVAWGDAERLAHACLSGAQTAIASRALDRRLIQIHQPWFREWLGKIFNLFVRLLTGMPFVDTQCGMKLFRRDCLQGVLERCSIDRFAWDVELLWELYDRGVQIEEVSVKWQHREDSRVRVGWDGLEMGWCVLKVKFRKLLSRHSPKDRSAFQDSTVPRDQRPF